MKPEIKELGLKALLEKGEIEKFFDVQMKEKDNETKGQLIGSIARIADMLTQHSQGVFVDEITNRLSKSLIEVAKELSNGLSEDLKGTEADLKAYVDATDDESRSAILSELDRKVNTAEENLRSAIENTLNSALPELAESARLSDDEVAEIVSNASLSVESQMSELIGAYLADNSLTVSEIEGFQAAVTEIVNNRDISDVAADFTRLRNIPNVLQDFLSSGGKFRIRSMIDVKNWDDFQDGYALVWDANDKKLKPAEVSALPSQTGNSGKFLTTDGTTASWATLAGGGDMAAATYDPNTVSGDAFLMTNMNGGNWKVVYTNGTGDITELALGASGTYLKSNGATSAPTFDTPTATVSAINDIGDVTITTPADNEVLAYDTTSGEWINQTPAEAGLQEVLAEGAFVDGDKTKLDGIEASADVTDTANVTAAGALMDSEVTNLAAVKAFDPTDYATAAQGATADSALQNVVEDTTPQLGGQLDINGQAIGDGTRELLTFTEDASAVNHVNIENEATGGGPIISAAGDDTSVDLNLKAKGALGRTVIQDPSDTTKQIAFTAADSTTGVRTTLGISSTANRTVSFPDATGTLLMNVVEDTTPQLGGNLDVNGNSIVSASGGNVTINPDGNGNIVLTADGTGVVSIGGTNAQLDVGGLLDVTGNIKIANTNGWIDGNDNEVLVVDQTASAVNEITIANAATGNAPALSATGGDTNIDLSLSGKGTGGVIVTDLQVTGHIYQDSIVDNGNSGTADTIDWGAGNIQKSTLTGNCTYTFTAPDGVGRFSMQVIQDATGSRTVTWPASVRWPGGTAPTLSTAANAVDIITFQYDGTNYDGVESLNFS